MRRKLLQRQREMEEELEIKKERKGRLTLVRCREKKKKMAWRAVINDNKRRPRPPWCLSSP